MKILLCGYHEAGYRALRHLVANGYEVAVATHEAPKDLPSLVHFAAVHSLPCVCGSLSEVHALAVDFQPDIIFSVYYRSILPEETLALAPRGAFNFHPSLLPKHRGCFSAPWAIIEGDLITGVTCHRMIEQVDQGDIVAVMAVNIDKDDTGIRLFYKLIDATVYLFALVVAQASQGDFCGNPQTGEGSYHKRELPYGGVINPDWPRKRVDRFIRAMVFPPFPPAQFMLDGVAYPIRSMKEYNIVRRRQSRRRRGSSTCVL